MKTLIIGAGPLGSLYTYLFHKAGNDVTLLARGEHYEFLREKGLILINEFTGERIVQKVNVTDRIQEDDYDLVIVLMRKNNVLKLLPVLSKHENFRHILFMGNNTAGFNEYLRFLPEEKVLFGFPGAGGTRIDHVVHYVDSEKPNGPRMPVMIGEIDGKAKDRTKRIKNLFESSGVPVKIVDDIDSWLKYHVAFIQPIAGALLKAGDNYKLAQDKETIRKYIRAVNECSKVLRTLGYEKSYNPKLSFFRYFPEWMLIKILKQVFDTKFAEVAMMMHVNAAADEMLELGGEFNSLINQTALHTPNFHELLSCISNTKITDGRGEKV